MTHFGVPNCLNDPFQNAYLRHIKKCKKTGDGLEAKNNLHTSQTLFSLEVFITDFYRKKIGWWLSYQTSKYIVDSTRTKNHHLLTYLYFIVRVVRVRRTRTYLLVLSYLLILVLVLLMYSYSYFRTRTYTPYSYLTYLLVHQPPTTSTSCLITVCTISSQYVVDSVRTKNNSS